MPAAMTFAGGLLIGLASSLHCAGMCGGISALSFTAGHSGASLRAGASTSALAHVGRVSAYMALGAIAGGLGTAAIIGLEPSMGHRLLRWAAALSLCWVGLSTAGWLPGPGRFLPRVNSGLGRFGGSSVEPLLAGAVWGFMPCAMVYGALLYALFSGSALGGAAVMAGFGLGTLPSLALSTVGFAGLKTIGRRPGARIAAGLAIAALGIGSVLDSAPAVAALCGRLFG